MKYVNNMLIFLFLVVSSFPVGAMELDFEHQTNNKVQIIKSLIQDKNVSTFEMEENERNQLLSHSSQDYSSLNFSGTDNLDEFLEWYYHTQLSPPSITKARKIAKRFGQVNGVLSGLVYFTLGYEFVNRFLSNAPRPLCISLASLDGLASFVPVALLGANLSGMLCEELVTKPHYTILKIEDKNKLKKFFRILGKGLSGGAGVISSPPIVYLSIKKFEPFLSYGAYAVVGVPTVLVKTLIDTWSINALSGLAYDYASYPFKKAISSCHPHSRTAKIFLIRKKLQETQYKINGLSIQEANVLANKILITKNNEVPRIEDIYNSFSNICFPENIIKNKIVPKKPSLGERVFNFIGGSIGVIGMACIYPLAEDSIKSVLQGLGIASSPLLTGICTWAATGTASSLMAWATGDSFGKFYNAIALGCSKISKQTTTNSEKVPNKRIATAITAAVLALAAGSMQAELSIEFLGTHGFYEIAALACSATAVYCTNFWAVDSFVASFIMGNHDMRPALNNIIQNIINEISNFKDVHINRLYEFIKD